MANLTRRTFIKAAGGAAAAVGLVGPARSWAAEPHVVVIGGGYGGAIAAKYLRMMSGGKIKVTMIERDESYYSCPLSNWVVAGFRDLGVQKHSWAEAAKAHGFSVIHKEAEAIDPKAKTVSLAGGEKVSYDKLIVSPGVDYKDNIEGYTKKEYEQHPHAWHAGPQTEALKKKLAAMPDGGKVIIVPPEDPFRCPPGPYERVSLIAHYLKKNKPKSKILVLDPKDKFSKQGLFAGGWKTLYGYETPNSLIEWVAGASGGKVARFDAATGTVFTEMDQHKGDVVNIIPNQKAGQIAFASNLVEGDWCPVNKQTFESTLHKDVYVIGDACNAAKMPKSGYAANSQAKVCVEAVIRSIHGKDPADASYVNTCYSMLSPDYAISVANVFKLKDGEITPINGGMSPPEATPEFRKMEAEFNESWYRSIMADMFA
ncbi:MAG: FAD-dependent oxidoreductase [Magnetococcales bacterium]|nr:FAD-dependent oxidoreductase [Magnetococcales bacterium]MBF0156675.1 FAD-dependent oxidoreductase [Magnetococcales bacterium]